MIHLFGKKKTSKENYVSYLEKENETLRHKIERLEKERDHALSKKESSAKILNKYKAEYESLIRDSKKLIEKQKKAGQAIDGITESYKNALGNFKKN